MVYSDKTAVEAILMLERLAEQIRGLGYNLYGIASISDDGAEYIQLQPANLCQNSYSVAKLFTATAIGMLWDAGRLDMDERVADVLGRYFPAEADPRWREVTVDHLLRHRAGFGRGLLDIDVDDASAYDTRDYLSLVLREKLPYEPGTQHQYTDAAFYVLSRIIAERAGAACDRLLAHALFDQLGFREAAWSRCPLGYPIGATGLYINARDMVKLGWAYLNEGVYNGQRIFSAGWARLAVEREYELHPQGDGYIGKGGMNGQKLMFSPEKRIAFAWHGYQPKGMPALEELLKAL